MRNFAAIDFETANAKRTSICSVGVVIVRNGIIEPEPFYSLVRPEPNYYNYYNQCVHGLDHCDTDDAPTFPEVWAKLAPRIEGLTLVAHNAAFDKSCLRAALEFYNMPNDYEFLCTLQYSRREHKFLPDHQLQTVAAYCGYDLTQHHNALADAEACAYIALTMPEMN